MCLVWKWRDNGSAISYLSIKVFTIIVSHSVSNHLFDYYMHEVTESIDICLSVNIVDSDSSRESESPLFAWNALQRLGARCTVFFIKIETHHRPLKHNRLESATD
jgi:hypothetical protein